MEHPTSIPKRLGREKIGNRDGKANENGKQKFRVVLSGYYGFRNSGDEAVLKSILAALEAEAERSGIAVEPVVLSGDPEWTRGQYGVEAVHRTKLGEVRKALKNSDGLISGGGSLLQDATGMGSIPYYLGIMALARWAGKPTFVYAQGIGPVNRAMFKPFIARAFKKAAYVSVRDEESASLLRGYGVDPGHIEVVPDPVMGLPLPAETGGEGVAAGASAAAAEVDTPPLVGVSVRFWRGDRADMDRVADALEALARRRPGGVRLRFLPFHRGEDEDASRYVMERLARSGAPAELELAPAHDDPQQMLREVGRCALLIGMRLHSLIYAANRNIPLLGVSYDPKIDQFLQRLGQRAVGTTEALDAEQFAREADDILRDSGDWHQKSDAAIERLKQEATRPAQQIIASIRTI
ncbi:polysaccharide pyruvyl transferase CsaB [Cohnella endophytica]|uniref:Polysaccharide pyruvyl transferase CsaB n=1 Tax=Cohnella endophytica TaxID=2419778 RepID=A0A494X996_9BACL|nr:polysaccharide pyruvyl transferase CsaB [Cohnella endophytica]RKP47275.1 polysaccharide pyruvyl transferase CsaB [Cohnella endophytica]